MRSAICWDFGRLPDHHPSVRFELVENQRAGVLDKLEPNGERGKNDC